MNQTAPELNSPTQLTVLQGTIKESPGFWVRYFLRENGNIVYQFYSEDPKMMDEVHLKHIQHKHKAFPPKFQESLQTVFAAAIPSVSRRDIAFMEEYNSYSVIARGYVGAFNQDSLLDPLFDKLSQAIQE